MSPLVGITGRSRHAPASSGPEAPIFSVTHEYVRAVEAAGGVPVVLPVVDPGLAEAMIARLDALVLTGGGDVDPECYGGDGDDPRVAGVERDRDDFEIALVRSARAARLATLAICRGLQVTNVAFGGDLITDVASQVPDAVEHSRRGDATFEAHQAVRIDPDSRLATVLEADEVHVNALHHQAVDRCAQGFRPVAWALDGVVEAIEPRDDDWPILAVQWHPEYLAVAGDVPAHRLFAHLVRSASRRTAAAAT
ncbi:MAG: gamma-glutamyl-gamma-aminobutyrate hydrolase family protein [Actinomycetota bacterium]|nr:gamma-glutamyl-gamma-aminobutyrate hydrolase family protein [Actinomycetota bacterium]